MRELGDLATRANSRQHIARAFALLGDVAILEDRPEDANRLYAEAIAAVEQHSCPTVQWRLYAGAARVAASLGNSDLAESRLGTAARIITEVAAAIGNEAIRDRFLGQESVRGSIDLGRALSRS